MLIDRYPPADLFALVPALYADFEPVLRQLDHLLDDDVIVEGVRTDLARRAPHTLTHGRRSTPVEVILRLLVVRRLYGWSYEETEHFVADSLVLRQFCRVYLERVPDDTTLLRWANLIAPATLERLNARVVELARSLRVTRGRKLRVDTTVVETPIHHPTDSGILGDGVRVLSRLLRRAKPLLGAAAGLGRAVFRTRTRSVRRLAQAMHRVARRKGADAATQLRAAYERLVAIARDTHARAHRVREALQEVFQACGDRAAERLRTQLDAFLPRVERAMAQTVRRVLHEEQVPAREKILSLFEPHTQLIVRHKAGKPVEYGRKLWLDEVDGGIVSRYEVLAAVGPDARDFPASLAAHQAHFGRAPDLVATDRGVSSTANERLAREAGVRHIAMPAVGRAPPARLAEERTRWFRRGFRFRAGIEGRISVLQRRFGLARCRDHGEAGMGRWVGWGIVAHNLAKIAATTAAARATIHEHRAA
jgi:transposase, IS5 family